MLEQAVQLGTPLRASLLSACKPEPVQCCAGRDCTYYKAIHDEQHGTVQLVESSPQPPLNMQNKSYSGVTVQPAAAV